MSCFNQQSVTLTKPKKIQLAVAAVLIDHASRILVQQRPKDKTYAGYWEFPGGKLEVGETPETALVRELKEELDIDTKESCLAPIAFASHAYGQDHLLLPVYLLRQWHGQPKPMAAHELRWLNLQQVSQLENLLPANYPLIPLLREWV